MHAQTHFIMASAGAAHTSTPKTLACDQLSDVMPSIALVTEALNHALIVLNPSDWTREKYAQFGPAAMTQNMGRVPPRGIYSAWVHFAAIEDGFSVVLHDTDKNKEQFFTVTAGEKGGFHFRTHDGQHDVQHKETLTSAKDALTQFGAWMQRNFSAAILAETAAWSKKLAESPALTRTASGPVAKPS